MKKIVLPVILGLSLIVLPSCSSIFNRHKGVVGTASIAEDKARTRIELSDTAAAKVNVQRLDKIGAFSSGIDYSLQQDTNQSTAVKTAMTLNERVIALANKPDFNEAKAIALLVDELITNKDAGDKLLQKKDIEIEKLMTSIKTIQIEKDMSIGNYIKIADKTAATADQYKSTLGEMDSWGGLGAIWYGLKRLFT